MKLPLGFVGELTGMIRMEFSGPVSVGIASHVLIPGPCHRTSLEGALVMPPAILEGFGLVSLVPARKELLRQLHDALCLL
jgi:hypothetical protein